MATLERQHQTADAADLSLKQSNTHGSDNLQEYRIAPSAAALKERSPFVEPMPREQECAKIAELFGTFDINRDGYLDRKEIKNGSANFGRVERANSQLFSKFLSDRYNSLMATSNDEWGFENNGVSLRDINKYVDNVRDFSRSIKAERGDTDYKLTLQGREREVTVHVPPQYDGKKPMPMVVMLHGFTQNKDEIARISEFKEKADKEGFIAVFPNATGWVGDHLRWWNVGENHLYRSDDVDLIRQLTEVIPGKMNVDKDRIYLVGFSNGAMMAQEAAVKLNDRIAAVASVSGGMLRKQERPSSEMNALLIHGRNDEVIPASGGKLVNLFAAPRVLSSLKAFEAWADANGLKPTIKESRGEPIQLMSAVDSETGREVSFYELKEGSHDWPGSSESSIEAEEFKATDEIWKFLNRHNKKELASGVRRA